MYKNTSYYHRKKIFFLKYFISGREFGQLKKNLCYSVLKIYFDISQSIQFIEKNPYYLIIKNDK